MVIYLRNVFKMRKYHQLLLLLITFISLSTLLVYRREYLKLRYVLEVLNYFGSPVGGGDDCLVLNDTLFENGRNKNIFTKPQPTWVKIDRHFLYSSFWETEGDKLHIRAIAVGPSSAFTDIECHVWFDQGDFLSSVMGKFGYSLKSVQKHYNESKEQQTINVYELFCEPVETVSQGSPHGLVIIHKTELTQTKTFIPVLNNNAVNKLRLDKFAVCVRPDVSGTSKSSIVEFVTYHQVVGVTDFIFYDNGLQYKILSILETLAGSKGFSELITTVPWNFPFNDLNVESTVIELDCLARTSGMVNHVAVLNLDEYIVPRLHNTISELFKEATPSKRIPVQFELESVICCTDMKDDRRAEKTWPVALRKTHLMSIKIKSQLIIQYPVIGIEPSRHKLAPTTALVHIYRPCSGLKTITRYDPIMARFLGSMITSKLLRLWRSGSILEESLKT